ncbi:thyroid hormone receptor beta-like isoform X2 [Anneissia japonica]|uniref:thyroid hormone receptor beta-like isoform X2 n=1 Tax=Anneissia japonica TaxID=1529436 RepID=UPI0014254B39|nr:thyroid hormone receptor beta-like isoform X2 [Anneissia japonica]
MEAFDQNMNYRPKLEDQESVFKNHPWENHIDFSSWRLRSNSVDGCQPSEHITHLPKLLSKKRRNSTNSTGAWTPYVPSYMDLSNGPEPCVVCGDAATGYHYRCMTCEGCKGFFRRTIQKNLAYYCKWNEKCEIDKSTRNQCQQCRYKKCLQTGMAPDLVLNEHQRKAKRRLIQDNRERRHQEGMIRGPVLLNQLTPQETELINIIAQSHRETCQFSPKLSLKTSKNGLCVGNDTSTVKGALSEAFPDDGIPHVQKPKMQDLFNIAEIMTPSIVNIVEFAKRIPGFAMLAHADQVVLLKSCCIEIMCMRIAQKYDPNTNTLQMSNGIAVEKSQLKGGMLAELLEPIFDFAVGLSRLDLTDTEVALLSAVLLVAGDRPGLINPKSVEVLQDQLLTAFQHYINQSRPKTPVHWAKILMKVNLFFTSRLYPCPYQTISA